MIRATLPALGLLLLSACTTNPLPLVPTESSRVHEQLPLLHPLASPLGDPQPDGPTLTLRPVQLPHYLKRMEMVERTPDGAIKLYPIPTWSEPLDKGVSRVLMLNLAYLLKSSRVVLDDRYRRVKQSCILTTELFQLDADRERLRLEGRWQVTQRKVEGVRQSGWFTHTEPLGSGPRSSVVAQAMSRALLAMAKAQQASLKGCP
uniref:ABC-type transport auxiliary lipoprotein component domain-containing protein n=1 Tax=Magnetococcus massalia (strain MO-1) TaxID=451514 RepID=A0A1S7LM89_MAGMO|nr:Exported protein of unknown function [Candidatus Magnetococcus massalia]